MGQLAVFGAFEGKMVAVFLYFSFESSFLDYFVDLLQLKGEYYSMNWNLYILCCCLDNYYIEFPPYL